MNKLWLIIQREYLTRVKKKTFILATLLTPLGFGLIMFISGYLAGDSMNAQKKIAVVDQAGIIDATDLSNDNYAFEISKLPLAQMDTSYSRKGYDVLLNVPPLKDLKSSEHKVDFYSKESKPKVMAKVIPVARCLSAYHQASVI